MIVLYLLIACICICNYEYGIEYNDVNFTVKFQANTAYVYLIFSAIQLIKPISMTSQELDELMNKYSHKRTKS